MTAEERKVWYRMEDAIRESGLNKSEIARRGGFHRTSLTCDNDRRLPSLKILRKFCQITGCSADWLLGLRGEENGQM